MYTDNVFMLIILLQEVRQIDYSAVKPQYVFGQGKLDCPRGVAITAGGDIAVANTGRHNVVIYSATGDEVLQFGSEGSGNGQFDRPWDIAHRFHRFQ